MNTAELEKPPKKSDITIWGIIEICIFIYLGFSAMDDLFDTLTSNSGISFMGLVRIVICGLIAVGFLFAAFGFFKEDSQHLKTGILCFLAGCIGLTLVIFLYMFRIGFGIGSIIEILLFVVLSYFLYKQSQNC